ncbi:hypothetical protein AGMMS49960_02410 [Betaproteobacteria bacterium]|nr:hypothetical protein AGMMS49543_21890 [Betaproteobacteria bacterium]GHT98738.1 hypothetical protein AGMMS49960_02410 [Betaproteobacteria bacterium]GHU18586.1 hypothetical protein AGMMS50243_08870 [Betaproteobacteria bacterium]
MTEKKARTWLNASTKHEGFPIYFRRPDIRVSEFEGLRPQYPVLLAIKHQLSHVKDNGLPVAAYNKLLAPLDAALVEPFRDESDGLVALVETFAGKRTYYIYLAPTFDAQQFMSSIASKFQQESISWKLHDDPTWRLFNGYAADFQFA